jgi:Protein of unknown function (DUF2510)
VTTTTPPGWYPEPGHTGNGPALERWWDGNAWTEYTRTSPVQDSAAPPPYPSAYPGYPGYPGAYPGYPGAGSGEVLASPGGGRRTRNMVIAAVTALVLIGGAVTAAVVLGQDSDDDNTAKDKGTPAPTATAPRERQLPSPDPSSPGSGARPPRTSDGPAVDAYDGISLPVLSGWQGAPGSNGIGASVVTGRYPCPLDASKACVRGGAFADPAAALKITATTAEAAAKADIATNAADSYGEETYGVTTSHQQVLSTAVTVAGQQGYLVRWKIATKSGVGGYVESLAFPSPAPARSNSLVVVRFGFDIGGQAPGVEVMDQITKGIKADSSGGTSGTGV